ncbi:MAG: hypothetical protein FJY17_00795 [Bacteroidetes bacterium]|nr:hypothetical protein [Bacteroidota bacterium]
MTDKKRVVKRTKKKDTISVEDAPKEVRFNKEYLLEELKSDIYEDQKNGLLYVDNFLIHSRPVNVDLTNKTEGNGFVNMAFREKKKSYQLYLAKKKFNEIFTLLDKEKRMPFFLNNTILLFESLGEQKFYKKFRENLEYVDHHFPFRNMYGAALEVGVNQKYLMSSSEIRELERLPSKITIYRGVCFAAGESSLSETNKELHLGNSWTLSYLVAEFFSCCHAPKFSKPPLQHIILSYELNKKDIIALFLTRSEFEIFIDYRKVKINKVGLIKMAKNRVLEVQKNPLRIKDEIKQFRIN